MLLARHADTALADAASRERHSCSWQGMTDATLADAAARERQSCSWQAALADAVSSADWESNDDTHHAPVTVVYNLLHGILEL